MEYYGGCGFVVNDFHYIWESFPLYPLCWEFSLRMDMSFITCFSCICWDDHVAFIFSFVNVMYLALTDLHMLDHPVTLGCIRFGHGVWVFIGGVAFGLLVFCWGFLHLYIHQRYWLVIVFFCQLSLSGLVSGSWWLSRMTLEVFPPLQCFGGVWEGSV